MASFAWSAATGGARKHAWTKMQINHQHPNRFWVECECKFAWISFCNIKFSGGKMTCCFLTIKRISLFLY